MMKKLIIAFTFMFFGAQAWAQTEAELVKKDTVYSINGVDEFPIYPGCEDEIDNETRFRCFNKSLLQHISMEFVYPKIAREENLMGKVLVSFIIDENGEVKNVEIIKGEHESLNKEAIRIVKKLPKVVPAQKDGVPVSIKYVVPINFRLG